MPDQRNEVLRRLKCATVLCSCFMMVEVTGGLLCHSLAILSDAAHLFADLAAFSVAIAASYLASLPATAKHTYGLKRTESLAALFSMVSLVFVSVELAYEAVQRLIKPPEEDVDGRIMTLIAAIGVVVNVVLAFVLGEHHVHLPGGDHGHDHSHGHDHGGEDDHHHDHDEEKACFEKEDHHDHHDHHDQHDHHDHHGEASEASPLVHHPHESDRSLSPPKRNVNLHAAYLHVLGDLLQSVAVFLAGMVIWWKPEWHVIDPILTLCFCVLVLWSTVGVLRSSISVLLEEIPPGIDWHKVHTAISAVPNVGNVHDLHIWSISDGQVALSVHCASADKNAIHNINAVCKKFGVKHATIQVNEGDCGTCHVHDACTASIRT